MNTELADAPKSLLVAIDGPAGSGKSSVSREVADRLNFGILDTGAAYRALAWKALHEDVDLDDSVAVEELLDDWSFSISLRGAQVVIVGGEDVTDEIRDPGVSKQVSSVSKHAAVRERLNLMFLEIATESGLPGVIIEGRDITTVVAPHAPVRILMTASAEVRAKRRAGELPGSTYLQVLEAIAERDAKDQLVVDFMNPAPGVTLIDTSELDFEAVVEAVINEIKA
ncbi:MAG TPA: (d)CMP kinase [Microbacteriaceae bacterium]|nr:(d)CMP kinase [Microbacteriaceae bacterium]